MPPVDLACVIHCHSTHSDGTGTVRQIAAGAARAGVDVVLLTDHDTLAAKEQGEERWYGDVLVCVGVEVSPPDRDHYLAFGIDHVPDRRQDADTIVAEVAAAGGFGFAAHPFFSGSERFNQPGQPWTDLARSGVGGIELWSLLADTGEELESVRDAARFIARPDAVAVAPSRRNLDGWETLTALRRVVAIGGVDAHQFGIRIGNRVPLRLMSYRRSFGPLRTHVLLDGPVSGDAVHDRDAVYAALREGRCYIARDGLAPARGFDFHADGAARVEMGAEAPFADGLDLHVHVPRPAALRLLRDGVVVAEGDSTRLDHLARGPGVYRAEAALGHRTWVISNPVYLR